MSQIDLEEHIAAKALGIDAPGGGFRVILADPPWSFKVFSAKGEGRSAKRHYNTMSLDDICAMPVQKIAARDCHLFLWVTGPHLPHGLRVMEAWGFRYSGTVFVWVKTTALGKPKIGMGYWTRKQTEECLLFTRGSPRRLSKSVRQLITAPRREHSRKPDEIHDRIEALVAGPYLELFARTRRPGRTAWGNQTDRFAPCPPPGGASPVHAAPVDAGGRGPDLPRRAPGDGHAEAAGPSGGARSDDGSPRAPDGPAVPA